MEEIDAFNSQRVRRKLPVIPAPGLDSEDPAH